MRCRNNDLVTVGITRSKTWYTYTPCMFVYSTARFGWRQIHARLVVYACLWNSKFLTFFSAFCIFSLGAEMVLSCLVSTSCFPGGFRDVNCRSGVLCHRRSCAGPSWADSYDRRFWYDGQLIMTIRRFSIVEGRKPLRLKCHLFHYPAKHIRIQHHFIMLYHAISYCINCTYHKSSVRTSALSSRLLFGFVTNKNK